MAKTVYVTKSDVYFNTDLEKEIHRKVSAMRYGDTVEISNPFMGVNDKVTIMSAIKKSARYNCMELRIRWDKNDELVSIYVEYA